MSDSVRAIPVATHVKACVLKCMKLKIEEEPLCSLCQKPQQIRKHYGVGADYEDPEILQEMTIHLVQHRNCVRFLKMTDELEALEVKFAEKQKQFKRLEVFIFGEEGISSGRPECDDGGISV
jgi:hypothetical protein